MTRSIFLLTLAAAATSAQTSPSGLPLQNDDFVELHQTRCFGSCPSYTVRIYADGRVLWHGFYYVAQRGDAESRVPAADAQTLIEQFRADGFWTLPAEYRGSPQSEGSSTVTTLSIGSDRKEVSYKGAGHAPAWLPKLDWKIESLAGTDHWVRGDPRSERFLRYPAAGERGIVDNLRRDACYSLKPGVTPLMCAAATGKIDTVTALLSSGARASVNDRDASGWTALMYAAGSPRHPASSQIVEVLLQAGADPRIRSFAGQTVLMAVYIADGTQDAANKVRALVAAGAEVNAQDQWGETALMQSVRYAYATSLDEMKALLDAGARVDLRDRDGRTAIEKLRSARVSSEEEPDKEAAMALLLSYQK